LNESNPKKYDCGNSYDEHLLIFIRWIFTF